MIITKALDTKQKLSTLCIKKKKLSGNDLEKTVPWENIHSYKKKHKM